MWQQKLKFFEKILKDHPVKRENVFWNLNHINFVTSVVTKNPEFQVFLSLAHKKFEQLIIRIMFHDVEILLKSLDKNEKLTENCHSECVKSQRYSALFQRKSALFRSNSAMFQRNQRLKQCYSVLIVSPENLCFQSCSELNQSCS